jgi:MFS family permease
MTAPAGDRLLSPAEDDIDASSVARARIVTGSVFFLTGFVFSSWVPHIPLVKSNLELSSTRLGVALLSITLGAVLTTPWAGFLVARAGNRRVMLAGVVTFSSALMLPIEAREFATLVAALALFGAASGVLGVAMNAEGVTIEKMLGRPVMSSLHAMFSLGGLTGSSLAVLALSSGFTPRGHAATVVCLGLSLALVHSRLRLPRWTQHAGTLSPRFAIPRGPTVYLGLMALIVLGTEGIITDWSSVYLHEELASPASLSGSGYVAFSLAMTFGRLLGDRVVEKLGRTTTLRVGTIGAAVALASLLAVDTPVGAAFGFGMVGLALSNIVPILVSAAGRIPHLASGIGVAAVSSAGYIGFVVGPPLIGGLADAFGLRFALFICVPLLGVVALSVRSRAFEAPSVQGRFELPTGQPPPANQKGPR